MAQQEFFDPVAFDFLWEAMGIGEVPYPLQVPTHGATEDERLALRRRTNADLIARGVRDPQGRLEPHVEDWLTLLARPSVSIDALHIPDYRQPPVGVLAATDGKLAVLALQNADGIWIRPTYPESLASEVVGLLPPGTRGTYSSITLPFDEAIRTAPLRPKVGAAVPATGEPVAGRHAAEDAGTGARDGDGRAADAREPQDGKGGAKESGRKGWRFGLGQAAGSQPAAAQPRQRPGLAERTIDPRQAYGELSGQPRLRGGQLAANSRDHLGGRRRSAVLAWFDTASGRYLSLSRQGPDGTEWVTISPADAKTLRMRLSEMVEDVAG